MRGERDRMAAFGEQRGKANGPRPCPTATDRRLMTKCESASRVGGHRRRWNRRKRNAPARGGERSSEANELEPTNRSPNEMNVLITGSGLARSARRRAAGRRGARGHEMETLCRARGRRVYSRASRHASLQPREFTCHGACRRVNAPRVSRHSARDAARQRSSPFSFHASRQLSARPTCSINLSSIAMAPRHGRAYKLFNAVQHARHVYRS